VPLVGVCRQQSRPVCDAYAARLSPLDADDTASATDVDAYCAYLLRVMTAYQQFAIGILAIRGFAVSADERAGPFPWLTRSQRLSAKVRRLCRAGGDLVFGVGHPC
jgi:hypothetical protein